MRGLSLVRRMEHQRKGCIKPPQAPWGPRFFGAAAVVLASMLSPGRGAARTWHVPGDAPTIQAGINLASAGDDVLVGPGTYLEHDIVMRAGVWVHSEGGPSVTTVDASAAGTGFICADLDQTVTLEGFTILNGRAQTAQRDGSGGGVRCIESSLVIHDCVITGCSAEDRGGAIYAYDATAEIEECKVYECLAALAGGGICAFESTAAITDCEVIDNWSIFGGGIMTHGPEAAISGCVVSGNGAYSGGGIFCQSLAFAIRNCVVTRNQAIVYGTGYGLVVVGTGSISGCTVASNSGWGDDNAIYVVGDTEFDRTVVAFNEGVAFDCWEAQAGSRCCDVYGNAGGNEICGTDLGGNFSEDPLFCDAPNDDYTLNANSPCLPGNHPHGVDCGLIGARGWGCGTPPPTGACCFLDGSCVVAEQHDCEEQHGTYMGDSTTCDPNPCHPTPIRITTWGRIKAGFR